MDSITFDKDEFIQSIVGGDGNDDGDSDSDIDAPDDGLTAAHIRAAGESLQYRAPDGPDRSFEGMAPESAPTKVAAKLRDEITKYAKSAAAASLDAKDLHKKSDVDGRMETAHFIPLSNTSKPADTHAEEDQSRKRNRDRSIILRDENGEELPPWLLDPVATQNVLFTADSSIALHFEILEFARFAQPTQTEQQARKEIIMTIQSVTKRLWPNSKASVFGSTATELSLPSSDIDMCVLDTPQKGTRIEFDQLADALRNLSGFASRVQIVNAKVKLVKIIARESGMSCDISIGEDSGIRNVPLIKGFSQRYPAMKPLLLVVKCFLAQRNLNDVYTGGLGSYAIALMVLSHLQMLPYNFPKTKANLGALLQQFFELYGTKFNLTMAGLQVRDGGCYYDKQERFGSTPQDTVRLSIEDPGDTSNEIARNSFAVYRIRQAFSSASRNLVHWRRDDGRKAPTPLGEILNADFKFVRRRDNVIGDMERSGLTPLREHVSSLGKKKARRLQQQRMEKGNLETGEKWVGEMLKEQGKGREEIVCVQTNIAGSGGSREPSGRQQGENQGSRGIAKREASELEAEDGEVVEVRPAKAMRYAPPQMSGNALKDTGASSVRMDRGANTVDGGGGVAGVMMGNGMGGQVGVGHNGMLSGGAGFVDGAAYDEENSYARSGGEYNGQPMGVGGVAPTPGMGNATGMAPNVLAAATPGFTYANVPVVPGVLQGEVQPDYFHFRRGGGVQGQNLAHVQGQVPTVHGGGGEVNEIRDVDPRLGRGRGRNRRRGGRGGGGGGGRRTG